MCVPLSLLRTGEIRVDHFYEEGREPAQLVVAFTQLAIVLLLHTIVLVRRVMHAWDGIKFRHRVDNNNKSSENSNDDDDDNDTNSMT